MTLKLVTDNVSELPVWNTSSIVATFRRIADEIENGELGEINSALFVLDHADAPPEVYGCGEVKGTPLAVGLLEMAKCGLIDQARYPSDD